MANAVKTLVSASGGLDSAVVTALALESGHQVDLLHFQYGQRNGKRERTAVERLAKWAEVDVRYVRLEGVFHQTGNIRTLEHGQEGPSSKVEDNEIKGRNAVLISIAFSIAQQLGYHLVGFGAKQSQFPDCQYSYLVSLEHGLRVSNDEWPRLWLPIIEYDREKVWEKAMAFGLPYEQTWSCYESGIVPCGMCGACLDRAGGLQ